MMVLRMSSLGYRSNKGFKEYFRSGTPGVAEQTGGQVISVDGRKTARGSRGCNKTG